MHWIISNPRRKVIFLLYEMYLLEKQYSSSYPPLKNPKLYTPSPFNLESLLLARAGMYNIVKPPWYLVPGSGVLGQYRLK